ncbi:DUF411 domain-containing protein [Microbulbifer salipaludis]|uniref:DUF411 domain-containing protein n=1 Tax=Microbulbifer salipaludis TaxID=187980 RepID=A0ABS3E505_9GAMM|nr:DUF411 domain-containing protein [Microbulbifer salipaludis]MBN8430375.1 DUF411 domain-containing protein [Microbulbifer salipaludis]
MMNQKVFLRGLAISALLALTACAKSDRDHDGREDGASTVAAKAASTLTTYKSATCGCCTLWVEHATDNGFKIDAQDVSDLNAIKDKYEIAAELQSCHTSVSADGYVFEGHIPAKLIRQFLQNPPAGARGLAVPAMPLGSPGMEVGDRFTPYKVLQLNRDGSTSVYASIDHFEQQH